MPLKDAEKRKEYNRQYLKQYNKEYTKTGVGHLNKTIGRWRHCGLVGDREELVTVYQRYTSTDKCDICDKIFPNRYDKCMDHNHKTGEFRNILCRRCNTIRGFIDNDYQLIMKMMTF